MLASCMKPRKVDAGLSHLRASLLNPPVSHAKNGSLPSCVTIPELFHFRDLDIICVVWGLKKITYGHNVYEGGDKAFGKGEGDNFAAF